MQTAPNAASSDPTAAFLELHERKIILLLCGLAALHVFIFSAAFPFFNNVDEQAHFDLTVKYSHGDIPRRLENYSTESARYIVFFGSPEYLMSPTNFPDEKFPPPVWTWPQANPKVRQMVSAEEGGWIKNTNHESSQTPLYYVIAGFWWNVGQGFGFENGGTLYWLRFMNILFVVVLVWLGYATARLIFSDNFFVRLGIPALLAFLPQTAFYSVNNDILSPLCFGAAFICLIKFWNAEIPGARLGAATGLALAATYLTKTSNLPLLAVSAAFVLIKFFRLAKMKKWRASFPSFIAMFLCGAPPVIAWAIWCKIHFGDLTGSAPKIYILHWTLKPFAQWWHHPIFTPHGFWEFLSGLLSTFWHGEFVWNHQPMNSFAIGIIYIIASIVFVAVTLIMLVTRPSRVTGSQQTALWLGLAAFAASVAFLAFLSIIYDFHDCVCPSRAFPFFTSGRMMLGALIPFLLLFVFGLNSILKRFNSALKCFALAAFVLFMLTSEIITDLPAFFSQYNWYHL